MSGVQAQAGPVPTPSRPSASAGNSISVPRDYSGNYRPLDFATDVPSYDLDEGTLSAPCGSRVLQDAM